jgi:hypothetical protein
MPKADPPAAAAAFSDPIFDLITAHRKLVETVELSRQSIAS